MAMHGSLGEFDQKTGDWKSYIERAQQYFAANDVADANKQRAILLSSVGDKTYRTIKDVLSPEAPATMELATLIEKMTKHFQPAPSEIVQRYRFNTRIRQPNESVHRPPETAEHCNYGDAARINEMVRDRLVCGIENEKWQQRLLAEDPMTYKKAHKLLLSLEAAEKGTKDIAGEKTVHQVRPNRSRRNSRKEAKPLRRDPCSHCGGMHDPTGCRFKNVECNYCHRRGHIVAICRQKLKRQSTPQRRSTHVVEAEGTDPPAEYTEPLNNVRTPNSKPLLATLQIQGTPVQMEIDTGATLSVMTYDTYSNTWNGKQAPPIKPTTANLRTYTGEAIKVVGAIDVDVEYEGQQAKLNLVIVDGTGPSLLGRDWLHQIRLDWAQFHKVEAEKNTQLEQNACCSVRTRPRQDRRNESKVLPEERCKTQVLSGTPSPVRYPREGRERD